jgi:hypothetical protein
VAHHNGVVDDWPPRLSGDIASAQIVQIQVNLESLQPSKNHPFLVVVAGNYHQKNGDLGEAGRYAGSRPIRASNRNSPGAAIKRRAASSRPQTFHSSTPRTRPSQCYILALSQVAKPLPEPVRHRF